MVTHMCVCVCAHVCSWGSGSLGQGVFPREALPTMGNLWSSGLGGSWCRVGGGQGCFSTPYSPQDMYGSGRVGDRVFGIQAQRLPL